jgi:hypothetical protein
MTKLILMKSNVNLLNESFLGINIGAMFINLVIVFYFDQKYSCRNWLHGSLNHTNNSCSYTKYQTKENCNYKTNPKISRLLVQVLQLSFYWNSFNYN